jgi:hypothetical protein
MDIQARDRGTQSFRTTADVRPGSEHADEIWAIVGRVYECKSRRKVLSTSLTMVMVLSFSDSAGISHRVAGPNVG